MLPIYNLYPSFVGFGLGHDSLIKYLQIRTVIALSVFVFSFRFPPWLDTYPIVFHLLHPSRNSSGCCVRVEMFVFIIMLSKPRGNELSRQVNSWRREASHSQIANSKMYYTTSKQTKWEDEGVNIWLGKFRILNYPRD